MVGDAESNRESVVTASRGQPPSAFSFRLSLSCGYFDFSRINCLISFCLYFAASANLPLTSHPFLSTICNFYIGRVKTLPLGGLTNFVLQCPPIFSSGPWGKSVIRKDAVSCAKNWKFFTGYEETEETNREDVIIGWKRGASKRILFLALLIRRSTNSAK